MGHQSWIKSRTQGKTVQHKKWNRLVSKKHGGDILPFFLKNPPAGWVKITLKLPLLRLAVEKKVDDAFPRTSHFRSVCSSRVGSNLFRGSVHYCSVLYIIASATTKKTKYPCRAHPLTTAVELDPLASLLVLTPVQFSMRRAMSNAGWHASPNTNLSRASICRLFTSRAQCKHKSRAHTR